MVAGVLPTVANPSVITLLPNPNDQSCKQTFITYQKQNGLGAILCESFPTCDKRLRLTLRCNLTIYAISSVAVSPRYDKNLPFHYILYSSSTGDVSTTLSLLICWRTDCSVSKEVEIDHDTVASLFASSISITLTTCSNGVLACPLIIYNKQSEKFEGTGSGINMCQCSDPLCSNRNMTAAVVELGEYSNDPGPIYIGLTDKELPLISYFSYKNTDDDIMSSTGLKVSRYNSTGTNNTEQTISTLAIANDTGMNYAMASAMIMTPTEQQVVVVYTTDESIKLYAKSCQSKNCNETPMNFGDRILMLSMKGENTTISQPTVNIDFLGYPMVTFFQVMTNSTGTYNYIGIARCATLNCELPIINIVEAPHEPSIVNSRLSSQFLFCNPAVVYMRTNHSLEYIRCQDCWCEKPAMRMLLDDAVASQRLMMQPINLESFVITSVIVLQLCLLCIWISNKESKRSDFISKYVTTPYLSTVKMTSKTRSWLRFLMSCSFFFATFCIGTWFVYASSFLVQLIELSYSILFPPVLGFITWLLMRKARGGRFVTIKTLVLTGLWVLSVFGVLWSLHHLWRMKFPDCSWVNEHSLKTVSLIGGIGQIMCTFLWIFILNNIRLALKSTKPECTNLLSSNRWMGPHVQQDWLRNVHNRQKIFSGAER